MALCLFKHLSGRIGVQAQRRSSRRRCLLFESAIFALVVSGAPPASSAPTGGGSSHGPEGGRSLICIERPEEMGRLNITPATVRLFGFSGDPDGNPVATLIGGQNVCFRVRGRTGRLEVRFPYPYGGPSEPTRYWTASFHLEARKSKNNFELAVGDGEPRDDKEWDRTGWHNMWRLRPTAWASDQD